MATVPGTGVWVAKGQHQKTWTPMANGDVGTPLDDSRLNNKTASVSGTFGAAGSVVIEGGNDGVNYSTLNSLTGAPLVFGVPDSEGILEVPRYVRPRVAAGDGTTAITVIIGSKADV